MSRRTFPKRRFCAAILLATGSLRICKRATLFAAMKSLFLIAVLAVAYAQPPSFEVVSIKMSPPDAGSTVSSGGGPGNIVWIAFNLRSQQLIAPDWMKEPRFDITAKIPEGASFPVVLPGISGVNMTRNRARGQWLRAKIERFVRDLDNQVGKPVIDATGLNGIYDFSLFWVPDPTRPDAEGPTIFSALQDQLGLKLESKKVMLPVVVVDHAQKVPTEN